MKIVVSGATGLVGSKLVQFLNQTGHEVHRLVRTSRPMEEGDIVWGPSENRLDPHALTGADAVICLSGENIAEGRWTDVRKRRIRKSRVDSALLLSRTIANMEDPPEVFVCASATGYYGANRGNEILTDESESGHDFLAQVCVDWEHAASRATEKGVRTVFLRFGIVLSRDGGALRKMLLPFQLGVGGVIGDGSQYMSWLSIDEAVGIIDFALQSNDLEGAVNALSPNPVTNREFTKALGRVLRRPTIVPIPGAGVRFLFGEMGEALLLGSARAVPRKLEATGYRFRFPELEGALRHALRG